MLPKMPSLWGKALMIFLVGDTLLNDPGPYWRIQGTKNAPRRINENPPSMVPVKSSMVFGPPLYKMKPNHTTQATAMIIATTLVTCLSSCFFCIIFCIYDCMYNIYILF